MRHHARASRLLTALLALFTLAFLAGCGDDDDPPSDPQTEEEMDGDDQMDDDEPMSDDEEMTDDDMTDDDG